MDIHKPKPMHNWREFLAEIAVVVLGVLIALSAEQVVENLHEARSAREAREALREELVQDLSDEQIRRNSAQACITRRLDEIGAYLDAVGRGEAVTPPSWIGRPPIAVAYNGQWLASAQSGRVSLLPKVEAANYADLYYRTQQLQDEQTEEQRHWTELRTLQRLPRLTPQMIKEFQVALSGARYSSWRIQLFMLRMRETAQKQEGLKPDPGFVLVGEQPKAVSTCIPINTPGDKALAMIGTSYGDPN